MTLRRILIGLFVAVVATAVYAWIQRPKGEVLVRFERWGGNFSFVSTPIISIANSTNREISFRGATANEVSLGFMAESDEIPFAETFVILPNAKHEVCFLPGTPDVIPATPGEMPKKLPWPIEGRVEVVVVPWTDAQKDEASARYAGWPRPVREWLMQKYTARPGDRYSVIIPPKPDS
jgi:hypothetical protein